MTRSSFFPINGLIPLSSLKVNVDTQKVPMPPENVLPLNALGIHARPSRVVAAVARANFPVEHAKNPDKSQSS